MHNHNPYRSIVWIEVRPVPALNRPRFAHVVHSSLVEALNEASQWGWGYGVGSGLDTG